MNTRFYDYINNFNLWFHKHEITPVFHWVYFSLKNKIFSSRTYDFKHSFVKRFFRKSRTTAIRRRGMRNDLGTQWYVLCNSRFLFLFYFQRNIAFSTLHSYICINEQLSREGRRRWWRSCPILLDPINSRGLCRQKDAAQRVRGING